MPLLFITSTAATTTGKAAVAVTCLLAGLAPSAVSHADDYRTPSKQHHNTETCRGVRATHVNENGTNGNDVLVVTEAMFVSAGAGDDVICVKVDQHDDEVHVFGGSGDDTIITYAGKNFISGGDDDDVILSNTGDISLAGNDGNDTIYMGRHPDVTVAGNDGNDMIFGTPFDDVIDGGAGNDLIIGFAGNDRLLGGTGSDRLEGRQGTDELDGGAELVGWADDDTCIDEAAPATIFVRCETIVGLGVPQGPGGLKFG